MIGARCREHPLLYGVFLVIGFVDASLYVRGVIMETHDTIDDTISVGYNNRSSRHEVRATIVEIMNSVNKSGIPYPASIAQ